MGVKKSPNAHEDYLFERAKKYIKKISWIPGIEMVAVVNSLSMYATHRDSDIDLFIVTKPGMIWFVRFFSTVTLWFYGVWRHGKDIRENFCLSFFITTDALNLEKIAIENDIYLYYWIKYMKPILIYWNIYDRFLEANSWVTLAQVEKQDNMKYLISWDQDGRNNSNYPSFFNNLIKQVFQPKALYTYKKLWYPKWVIVSDDVLKFHDKDRREYVRDHILEK